MTSTLSITGQSKSTADVNFGARDGNHSDVLNGDVMGLLTAGQWLPFVKAIRGNGTAPIFVGSAEGGLFQG